MNKPVDVHTAWQSAPTFPGSCVPTLLTASNRAQARCLVPLGLYCDLPGPPSALSPLMGNEGCQKRGLKGQRDKEELKGQG